LSQLSGLRRDFGVCDGGAELPVEAAECVELFGEQVQQCGIDLSRGAEAVAEFGIRAVGDVLCLSGQQADYGHTKDAFE
jgi:hypothetical protein